MTSYVIVGASRGLGYEWLRELSKEPEIVVVALARSPGPLQAKLDEEGLFNVKVVPGDLEDNKSMQEAAARVSEITNGALDYLIINGAYTGEESWHLDPTEFQGQEELLKTELVRSVEVNIAGLIYTVNAFLPLVRKGSVKKIVAITSGHADIDLILDGGIAVCVVYSAMKAALNVVVAKYAAELRPEGIKFLALSPGVVATEKPTPTEAQIKKIPVFLAQFQKVYPTWKGIIQPKESIIAQRKVIDALTLEQSGQFLSHWGNKQWL